MCLYAWSAVDLSRDMFFPAVHFFTIYSQIGVTSTLLIVSASPMVIETLAA